MRSRSTTSAIRVSSLTAVNMAADSHDGRRFARRSTLGQPSRTEFLRALRAQRPQHRGQLTSPFANCPIRGAGCTSAIYRSFVSSGGRAVALPVESSADVAQAQVFHALLAARRAGLCDRLDEQAIKLAHCERSRDSAGARRKRLRIKEIGAEIRDIDRMVQGLMVRLLGDEQRRCSG